MRDATVTRLARLVDAGHLRWRAGRVQVHADCASADRRWLERHADAVSSALSPFRDATTAAAAIAVAFPGTTTVDNVEGAPDLEAP